MPYAKEDYWCSAMGALITSTSTLSFIGQATGNSRHWVTDIALVNLHTTMSTIIDIISGGRIVYRHNAPANAGFAQISFQEPGIPMSLNSGIELQGRDVASWVMTMKGVTKSLL